MGTEAGGAAGLDLRLTEGRRRSAISRTAAAQLGRSRDLAVSFAVAEDAATVPSDDVLSKLRKGMVVNTQAANEADNKTLAHEAARRRSLNEEAAELRGHHMTQFKGNHEFEMREAMTAMSMPAYRRRDSILSGAPGSVDTASEQSVHSSDDSDVEDKAPHPLTVKHLALRCVRRHAAAAIVCRECVARH